MSDSAALLAAIRTHPDEDAPRLVYADWLEEHDQPERAEFIRVECETARTDRDSPMYPQLLRRSGQLSARNAARWFGPLADDDVVDHIITQRGFIDCVVLPADGFAAHAEIIFAHAPVLREVHVTVGGDWRAFFSSLRQSSIRALSFADGVFAVDAARELSVSDHAVELVELNLDRQPLGPQGMAAVASAPLRSLEKLSAGECGIEDYGAEQLFAGAAFENLRELDLSENGLADAACHALAEAPGFGRLERLAVCSNYITADGLSALAAAPHLSRLRCLNLYSNSVGPAGGRAILASRHWGGLCELNLIGCEVGVEVVGDLRWVYGNRAVKA
jgi:uncharacterized protein (TIGR02996 family)